MLSTLLTAIGLEGLAYINVNRVIRLILITRIDLERII